MIRDEATRVIAGIGEGQLPEVADAWAATQEWQLDHGDPEFLGSLVRQLRDLARQAGTPTERLYLRISL